jgi:hypothetical protein
VANDKVTIVIDANATKAVREIKKVNNEIRKTDSATKAASKGLGAAGLAIGAIGAAAAVAAEAFVSVIAETSRLGDEIAKTARVVGVTGEELQVLRFAAERSAVSASSLEGGLKRLAKSMYDASRGSKLQAETFRAMGVQITTATGELRPVAEVFAEIADHAQEVGQGTELAAQTMTVMGRSGADLANLLLSGSEGLEEYSDRLRELGGVMSEDLLKASEEFQDSVTDLNVALSGFRHELAEQVLPTMTDAINRMTTLIAKSGSLRDALGQVADAASQTTAGKFGTLFVDTQLNMIEKVLSTVFPKLALAAKIADAITAPEVQPEFQGPPLPPGLGGGDGGAGGAGGAGQARGPRGRAVCRGPCCSAKGHERRDAGRAAAGSRRGSSHRCRADAATSPRAGAAAQGRRGHLQRPGAGGGRRLRRSVHLR